IGACVFVSSEFALARRLAYPEERFIARWSCGFVSRGFRRVGSSRSMRTLAPETTLLYAKRLAAAAGISEVSDITDLDVLGVPVCVSVRPHARGESFTFGKGLHPVEAEVGAYMEALEFFFAEPGNGCDATRWGSAKDVSRA